jgi:hypothetical protein
MTIVEIAQKSDTLFAIEKEGRIAEVAERSSLASFSSPYQIVSMLAMLQFQASHFIRLFGTLSKIESVTRKLAEESGKEQFQPESFTETGIATFLNTLEKECEALDLDMPIKQINRIRESVQYNCSLSDFQSNLEGLRDRITDQLEGRLFMFIPSEKAAYWYGKMLLDSDAIAKIADASYDLYESGKCFAAGRYTATVFHLMRALEYGVSKFADQLQVNVNPRDTWGMILGNVDNAIGALPENTDSEREYRRVRRAVSASLHAVKDAWRDATMHPRATYTEEDARDILAASTSFLRQLTAIL